MLHIEQRQTAVTLRKRYKKTKTTHCRKGSWMLLYSVVKVKTKQNCRWHPVKRRGADLDRHAVIHCWAWENGHKGGGPDIIPRIQYEGIPMPRMFVETKRQ